MYVVTFLYRLKPFGQTTEEQQNYDDFQRIVL